MRCRHVRSSLSEHLDARLPEGRRAEVESHLASCAGCRADLDRLRRTADLLGRLPRPAAPGGFTQRVVHRALEEPVGAPVAPPRVARPSSMSTVDLAYRVAVVVLLASINLALLSRPDEVAAQAPRPGASAPAAEAASIEPVVEQVDRYRDFFKTVDILATRPAEARTVFARDVSLLPADVPEHPLVEEDEEVARFLDESAEAVADLRAWTALDPVDAERRLAEIRSRVRTLHRRGSVVRERLISHGAGGDGASMFSVPVEGPAEFGLYAKGSALYFSGDYEPAKRYFFRFEEETPDGPLADSARYLLVQCLQKTGEFDKAAPIVMALRDRGVIGAEEFPELVWTFHDSAAMKVGVSAAAGARGPEAARFLHVVMDGREFPLRHGEAVRVFIHELRSTAAGDYLIRRRDEAGEPRVSETLRLDGGREFSVEYVSRD